MFKLPAWSRCELRVSSEQIGAAVDAKAPRSTSLDSGAFCSGICVRTDDTNLIFQLCKELQGLLHAKPDEDTLELCRYNCQESLHTLWNDYVRLCSLVKSWHHASSIPCPGRAHAFRFHEQLNCKPEKKPKPIILVTWLANFKLVYIVYFTSLWIVGPKKQADISDNMPS